MENVNNHKVVCFGEVLWDILPSGFVAGLLAKLLDNETLPAALEFASGLGAFIATQKGACPGYNISIIENLIQEKNKQYA